MNEAVPNLYVAGLLSRVRVGITQAARELGDSCATPKTKMRH